MAAETLLSNFNFAVQIELSGLGGDEGLALGARGAFSEVQGLEITLEPVSFREGGYNLGQRQLVGKTTTPALVLKRGLSLDPAFWTWVQRCLDGTFPLPYVSGTVRGLAFRERDRQQGQSGGPQCRLRARGGPGGAAYRP